MNNYLVSIAIAALLVTATTAHASQTVEARKNGVKLLAEANKKSSVLKMLSKGEAVTALERKGMYWKVDAAGQDAYVSVLRVKKVKKTSAISQALRDAVKQGRIEDDGSNSRARSAVMGVRGLDESNNVQSAGNVRPNMRMVYGMEDLIVNSEQLEDLESKVFGEAERNAAKKGL